MNYQVDPKSLQKLDRDEIIQFVVEWFETFHEDPVQEMPWVDGEYRYPYGGPYDASEVLHENFGTLLGDDQIKELVDQLEGEGTFEWAPAGSHPDQTRAQHEYMMEQHEWLLKTSLLYQTGSALDELEKFLKQSSGVLEGSLELRMAFIQCWSILEAYLSNTLTKHAQEDKAVFERLCTGLEAIKTQRFSASELAKNQNAPMDYLVEHLQRTPFHDLKRIKAYVETAFGTFADAGLDPAKERAVFARFVSQRHDCVHRNGKNLQDKESELSRQDVMEMLNSVRSYVEKVEKLAAGEDDDDKFPF